jgi:hypothetical protein
MPTSLRGLIMESLHLHRPIDDLAQVHMRHQAAVEADSFLTEMGAILQDTEWCRRLRWFLLETSKHIEGADDPHQHPGLVDRE